MICCDTCPLHPTCEEEDDFARELFGTDDDESMADVIPDDWSGEAMT